MLQETLIQTALFVNDLGQCYNPTEAGSAADGTGETSTSELLEISAVGNTLYTKTQMAFWQTPGSYDEGCYFDLNAPNPPWRGGYAVNEKALSDFILEKTVTIGYANMPNVIEYVSTITIPDNLGLTIEYFILSNPAIYLPTDFSSFYRYDPSTNTLIDMPNPAYGYSTIPAIAATPNGDYAMGLYTAEIPSNGFPDNEQFIYTGYEVIDWSDFGNVMLLNARMPKTNDNLPFTSGKYTYRSFLIVGRIEDVKSSMTQIYNMHPPIE